MLGTLSIKDEKCTIYWQEKGGRTVQKVPFKDMRVITAIKPVTIVLELGSYDICDPQLVAQNVTKYEEREA